MSELKTLKEIEREQYDSYDPDVKSMSVYSDDLKQEAVKWVKNIRNRQGESDDGKAGQVLFIKCFFNLTEEDLA